MTAIEAIPIFSTATPSTGLSSLSSTQVSGNSARGSFNSIYSSLQSQASSETPTPSTTTDANTANPKILNTNTGGPVKLKFAPGTSGGNAAANPSPTPAATPTIIPPLLPLPLPPLPEPPIPTAVAALPLAESASSVPPQGSVPLPPTQGGNRTNASLQTDALFAIPLSAVPQTSIIPPSGTAPSLQHPAQIPLNTPPLEIPLENPNPVPIPAPSLASSQLLTVVSTPLQPQTFTDTPSLSQQAPSLQTSSLDASNISTSNIHTSNLSTTTLQIANSQTPISQPATPPASSRDTPNLQTSIPQAQSRQTSEIQTSTLTASSLKASILQPSASPVSRSLDLQPPASSSLHAYPVAASASQNQQTTDPVSTTSTPSALPNAVPASLHSAAPASLPDTTLIAAANFPAPIPQPSAPTANPGPIPVIANSAAFPEPPTSAPNANQSPSVPTTPSATLASILPSILAASLPATPVITLSRFSNSAKNIAPTSGGTATPRTSTPAPANDSDALQNELSLASAVVFPAPSSNLTNVHTLVNSAALPVTTTTNATLAHSASLNSSTAQNSSNPTTASVLSTTTPVAASSAPSAKNISASLTASDSIDHASPATAAAIQLANAQSVPTPPVAPTTSAPPVAAVVPTPPANTAAPAATQLPAAPPTAPNSAPELPPAPPTPPGSVQMAQMVTHASQSEMHIGLNTSAFGAVDVHTVVHASEVGLSVGSEKGDLYSLLSNEFPTIANSLQQQSMRLTQVSFHQGSGLSGNSFSGGNSQQQRFTSSAAQSAASSSSPDTAEIPTALDNGTIVGRGAGLSILA